MSRRLEDLDYRLRPIAMELLARCVEEGVMVMIVDTLRTPIEQAEYLRRGASWTRNSKHLAQPPEGKSLAIDLCPFEQYQLHGPDRLQWDAKDPVWQRMGKIGEGLGLKWGIRISGRHFDLGHFELVTS